MVWSILALAMISHTVFADPGLYKVKSKPTPIQVSDLSPAAQQQYFELETEHYEKTKLFIESQIFDDYVSQEALKKKKTKEEVAKNILKIDAIKEKDAKEWYENNKSRVPYPFEQIKGEVLKLLENERREMKKKDWLKDYTKAQDFVLNIPKPVPPTVQINLQGYPVLGKADAKIKVVEFADYQCPHCKATESPLKAAIESTKGEVSLTYIDFPINPSGISRTIAQGAYCASKNQKFWEYHKAAFAKSPNIDPETPNVIAKELGLNEKDFKNCLTSSEAIAFVNKSKDEGERVGVSGTPFILINGKRYVGGHSEEDFKKAFQQAR